VNGIQLADHIGVSYRRIDHWTNAGYLQPTNPRCGTGHSREYPPGEVAVAGRIAGLVEAGLSVQVAAAIARGDKARLGSLLRALGLSMDQARVDAPTALEAAT
jgi:DNA-binding transcriptional MerR regulator